MHLKLRSICLGIAPNKAQPRVLAVFLFPTIPIGSPGVLLTMLLGEHVDQREDDNFDRTF